MIIRNIVAVVALLFVIVPAERQKVKSLEIPLNKALEKEGWKWYCVQPTTACVQILTEHHPLSGKCVT